MGDTARDVFPEYVVTIERSRAEVYYTVLSAVTVA